MKNKTSELNASISNAKVLLVDDNTDLLKLITIRLRPLQLEIRTAASAEEALSILAVWSPDLVITDLQMRGMTGMELFAYLHAENPMMPVIILTAHGTIPDAVEAAQSGVASFLTKPFDSDELVDHIQNALTNSGFRTVGSDSTKILVQDESWRSRIITKSPIMESLLSTIERLTGSSGVILLEGEPGSGKEALASAAHRCGEKRDGPFIHFSCISQTKDLIEAALFGQCENKAASQSQIVGKLREANGGTLLVTDFNEAPPNVMKKLMQALADNCATPINSEQSYEIDVSGFISSSTQEDDERNHRQLWELVDKVELTVLSVPSLREHREDIPLIANYYLQKDFAEQELQFSNKAMRVLLKQDWPGNVRQLINVVRQCARLTNTKIISESLVSSRTDSQLFKLKPLTNAHRDFERNYLTELLKVTNGNVTLAANLAKRNRTEIHRLVEQTPHSRQII